VGGPQPSLCFTTREDSDVLTYRSADERDCRCPTHRGQRRSAYNDPGCHCLPTCASQPITLHAPQINGALFLTYHRTLWYVPGQEPCHGDRRYATPVDIGHPLFETADLIADALRGTHAGLLPLSYRL
jgi:hypothetical protein